MFYKVVKMLSDAEYKKYQNSGKIPRKQALDNEKIGLLSAHFIF